MLRKWHQRLAILDDVVQRLAILDDVVQRLASLDDVVVRGAYWSLLTALVLFQLFSHWGCREQLLQLLGARYSLQPPLLCPPAALRTTPDQCHSSHAQCREKTGPGPV